MDVDKKYPIQVFNSLSGKKELFIPLVKGKIGMYICGPTVYNNVHIGNCRTFISFDLIYRYLKYIGYSIRYVRNITDVGHLEENEEDKIQKKARLEQVEPMEVAQRYTRNFHRILEALNAYDPDIEPIATGHIMEQIELTQELLASDLAYQVNGSVYFDVAKYNEKENYGELSKRNIDDLLSQTRSLDGQSDKRNSQDFALWKKASPDHIMRWNSPWGEGFPGWHTECIAMSLKYLGIPFDIHGGGMDLKFPHHECEIAQARAVYKTKPVNYWLHANMLTINGHKMSKSADNFLLPQELFSGDSKLLDKAYSPMVVRFFMLQAHYRSPLDFSSEALNAAEKGFDRLKSSIKTLDQITWSDHSTVDIHAWEKQCFDAMNDDFNSPILIAHLFEGVRIINQMKEKERGLTQSDLKKFKSTFCEFIHQVLGLKTDKAIGDDKTAKGAIELLIEIRNQARDQKNWELSDRIREDLLLHGIVLNDGKNGTEFQIITPQN